MTHTEPLPDAQPQRRAQLLTVASRLAFATRTGKGRQIVLTDVDGKNKVPYGSKDDTALSPAFGHAQQIRQAIRSVDPSFATFDIVTMTERRRLTTWGERFLATTFSTFAVIAVCLACLGTWAIVAYAVTQRRREVGVRLAIGATRADIVSLFLKGGAALAAGGLLIGTPLSIVTARVLGSGDLLSGVSPWDPRVWIGLSLAMAAAVLVATLQPAVRAGRVDPSEALRQ